MTGGHVDESGIKKGPWSTEEDEVLIDFVNQNGPTGWSSIRSKGLLPRTGKSCRLRWVNKLRPNLKVGCKFTAEEERVVVELQARFGNKWAKIASHLDGRTDNDVKNFWSSRQKRLARILHPYLQPSNKRQKQSTQKSSVSSVPQFSPDLQIPAESSNYMVQEAELPTDEYQAPEITSRLVEPEPISVAQLTSTADPSLSPKPLREMPLVQDPLWFTQLSDNPPLTESLPTQTNATLSPDRDIRGFVNVFADDPTSCRDLFPCMSDPDDHLLHGNMAEMGLDMPFFGTLTAVGSCSSVLGDAGENLANPDGFFDDFPTDVFDSLDPLPSSSTSFSRN